jgi:hypothetical protein
MPRRLTATRVTPAAEVTGSFMDSRPLEALVTGHVDERHALPDGQLRLGEPEVDGEPAAPLLGPPVRLHPRQRPYQRRLPVIDMPRGGDHLHVNCPPP